LSAGDGVLGTWRCHWCFGERWHLGTQSGVFIGRAFRRSLLVISTPVFRRCLGLGLCFRLCFRLCVRLCFDILILISILVLVRVRIRLTALRPDARQSRLDPLARARKCLGQQVLIAHIAQVERQVPQTRRRAHHTGGAVRLELLRRRTAQRARQREFGAFGRQAVDNVRDAVRCGGGGG
jgi:hypothetical protein